MFGTRNSLTQYDDFGLTIATITLETGSKAEFSPTSSGEYLGKELAEKLKGIVVISQDGVVSLTNESVKDFLLSTDLQQAEKSLSYFAVNSYEGNAEIARVLLSYLSIETFEKEGPCNNLVEWKEREEKYPLFSYAANSWHIHCHNAASDRSLIKLALKFWTTDIGSSYGSWLQAYLPKPIATSSEDEDVDDWNIWTYRDMETSAVRQLAIWDLPEFVDAALRDPKQALEKNEALLAAIENGSVNAASLLLLRGADITETTPSAQNVLHLACVSKKPDMLELMLCRPGTKNLIDGFDHMGETPLHYAAKQGDSSMVETLLKHGATVDVYAEMGRTALHHAAEQGHYQVLVKLLEAGANVNGLESLNSPLHVACYGRSKEWDESRKLRANQVVTELIMSGANPAAKDADGVTPLSVAAMHDHTSLVKAMLRVCSAEDTNVVGAWGTGDSSTALSAAICYGASLETVKLLVEKGARILPEDICPEQFLEELQGASMEVLRYILEEVPELFFQQASDKPTLVAALTEWWAVRDKVKYFCAIGQRDLIFQNHEPYSTSLLMRACQSELFDVILDYAEENPAVAERLPWDEIWKTIRVPCKENKEYLSCIRRFFRFQPQFKTREGLVKELFACPIWSDNAEDIFLFYLEKLRELGDIEGLCNERDDQGDTLLHFACGAAFKTGFIRLLDMCGPNIDINARNSAGETPLLRCFNSYQHNGIDIVKALIDKGADVLARDNKGRSILVHAVITTEWMEGNKQYEVLQLLLDGEARRSLDWPDDDGRRPIDHAVLCHNYGLVKMLESSGSELRTKDGKGQELLLYMRMPWSNGENYPLVEELLEKGADANAVNSHNGQSFFSFCIDRGSPSFLRKLITKYGLDPTVVIELPEWSAYEEGMQPIHVFHQAFRQNLYNSHVLLKYSKPEHREMMIHGKSANGNGKTSLHYAMERSLLAPVRWLIEAGADVDAVDAEGRAPLFFASCRGSGLTMVEVAHLESATPAHYLIKAGADVNFRNWKTGKTVYEYIRDTMFHNVREPALELLRRGGAKYTD
ncbi:Ankyrin-1 [Dactylella cylindrospora]|nr:Ankyrin-1 [Dactylella cylindrospora]